MVHPVDYFAERNLPMPVLRAPAAFTHELPNARFWSLATPSRGSHETSVWRIQLSASAEAAPHRLTREEVFVVLSGAVRVLLAGQASEAQQGDAIVVPPETDFALSCIGERAELLCCLPVGGKARLGDGPWFTPPWAE
jgi:quercetin dioxygenase-like cupin family protein